MQDALIEEYDFYEPLLVRRVTKGKDLLLLRDKALAKLLLVLVVGEERCTL